MRIPHNKKFKMALLYVLVGGNSTIAARIFSDQENEFYGGGVFNNLGMSPSYSLRQRGQLHPQVVANVYEITKKKMQETNDGLEVSEEVILEKASRFLGMVPGRLVKILEGGNPKPQEKRIAGKGANHKYTEKYGVRSDGRGNSSRRAVPYRSSNH